MRNYIRPSEIGVPINYVDLTPEDQLRISKEVIKEAYSKMVVTATELQKYNALLSVLEDNLKQSNLEERYEDSAVFRDLIKVVKTFYGKPRTQKVR